MYRVAILEDEKVYARIFEDYIGEFLKVREINYQVDIYETTKELEENINKDYHLFVLDHLAQDMNGMNFVRSGAYSWWSYRFNARKNNAGWRRSMQKTWNGTG